jgi:hypothetical protein
MHSEFALRVSANAAAQKRDFGFRNRDNQPAFSCWFPTKSLVEDFCNHRGMGDAKGSSEAQFVTWWVSHQIRIEKDAA